MHNRGGFNIFIKVLLDNLLAKEALENMILQENRFGFEPEITIKLAKKKLRFFEVGISYNGRTYQEGKKIGTKDGLRALYCLIKYRFF